MVEILPKDNLYAFVIGLKITTCNDHDIFICSIINMTSHGGSIGNTFDVIGHDLGVLKISADYIRLIKSTLLPRTS